ncbi:MAG: radical SAM protein [Saprospiraceae bacterium]
MPARLLRSGTREIVLTGVNLGDFGNGTEVIEGTKPKKEAMFIDLIHELDKVEGINRFRISSIEPNLCTQEVIDFVATSERFVPHFHIPLQSGSNKVLKMMRRRYQRELYAERVAWIKEKMPHACIGVDVIVGFPGESEEDFLETYHFLNDLDISYLHVFTYSERPNTPAAEMPDQVSVEERRRRNEMLTSLSEKKKRHFYNQHLGETRPVLFEQSKTEGKMNGFTENYIRVELDLQEELLNTIAPVQLNSINSDGLMEVELAPNLV